MRPQLLFGKIHKWMGLVLGIQILFWFLSGFLMSFMPIEEIHGDHLLKPQQTAAVSLDPLDFSQIANQFDQPIQRIVIKSWLGKTVVEASTDQQFMLFDTPDLKPITPISEPMVRAVLAAHLAPGLTIDTITRITEVPSEVRGRQAPMWQVQLLGDENARIYVSESNGEIVAKRTDRWRLFDFMWMLHIMDYDTRDDFNHPLLYLTALSALLFTLTGFVLLYFRLRRRTNK
ncbi:PepSY domain-containing protein [Marinicella litoralis]|uniref:PepSY-associated transmembrane protein n=1 Tax=Marinicella litoralis TaxID=644220 RepID=A0A4R6XUK3_9GAMM|nr:PepSY domain-containing protein [Marinicella litoralis]TDR23685.1 PepSY-associated transmembrane protein [Marinicella litoralis]